MGTHCNKRNVCNFIQIVAIMSACLLVDIASGIGYSQEKKPITRENLIAALKDCKNRRHCKKCRQCKLKASDFIRQIKLLKVDFDVSDFDEREIREAGSFLGKKECDELIITIRKTYRLSFGDKQGLRSLNTLGVTLVDSSGDSTTDEKIRFIVTSINNAFRLDTNYKFYIDNSPNMFSIANVDINHPDGTVFIGIEFIKESLKKDANSSPLANDSVLYFLIANNLSFLKQQKIGWTLSIRKSGLHGDFLAGWCVARFLKTTRDSPEYKSAFFKVISLAFRLGDISSPLEYRGTSKERLDAVSAGFGLQNEADPDKVYKKGIEYVSHL